jgi:cytochrome d ubiquinol oxidase subunit II
MLVRFNREEYMDAVLLSRIQLAITVGFHFIVESLRWRAAWDWAFGLGSLGPALLFGVAVGNILRGTPITDDRVFDGRGG